MTIEGDTPGLDDARGAPPLPKACPTCRARYPEEALFCSLDGAPLGTSPAAVAVAGDPYIGREIAGSIEIRRLVGRGSMGRVYRGFQKGVDRDVAIKILHRELSANPAVVARFEREAKVASRLQHPNVVQVLLAGTLPDGAMYLVMEYLDGLSLQSALADSGGSMPLSRSLHIVLALCDAVGEAHTKGIVHRDIKPENVMLVRRGDDHDFVKVLDFGIAHLAGGDPSTATAEGLIFGTARYISPEAAQGEKVGPPGDVYSIATVLYQLVAGRTPFEADQAVALLIQQIHDRPPPLTSAPRAADVPERIADVVMQNLDKRPNVRAHDGRALGQALLQAMTEEGMTAADVGSARSLPRTEFGMPGGVLPPSQERTWPLQSPEDAGKAPTRPQPFTRTPTAARSSRSPAVTEIVEELRRPLAVSTTRWSPGAALGLRLPSEAASLDATLDDASPPTGGPVHPTLPAPPSEQAGPTSAGLGAEPKAGTTVPVGFRDEAGDTDPGALGRRLVGVRAWSPAWTMGLVVACFAIGAMGMVIVGFRSNLSLPGGKSVPSIDAEIARASEALLHQQWDAPRGSNVRETTDEGLRRWPHDPQLLRIRSLASADIVKAARARRDEGNLAEALHLSRLAYELDPSDGASQKLVAELETQSQAPTTETVPPLSSARETASAPPIAAGGSRASLEISSARPAIGQPIDLMARVTGGTAAGRPALQGAGFRVTGPGIAPGTSLEAIDGGAGVYRATFAFLQAGRFDVLFLARAADGSILRASRPVLVAGPPVPNASSVPAPAPSATTPWM